MHSLKSIVSFLHTYFFHTASAATCLYLNAQLIRGFNINWQIVLLIFFSTLIIYNYSNQPTENLQVRKTIIVISFGCAFVLLTFQWNEMIDNLTKIILILILVLNYVLPLRKLKLRNVGFLKIFVLSGVWALTSVLNNDFSNVITQSTFILNFLIVFSISIPFDMRDNAIDPFYTIPKKVGIIPSMYLSITTFSIAIIILFFLIHSGILSLVLFVVGIYLLSLSAKKYMSKKYLAALELIIVFNTALLLFL